jgi:hypothetical protein
MFLLIAMALALVYAMLKPLSDGLMDTSRWVAKILAPADLDQLDADSRKQFLRVGQAALMEGWLSNVPFGNTILLISATIIGFFHSWWRGIVVFLAAVVLGELARILWLRSVSHYLLFLLHKMTNRASDYRAKNDVERSEACESFCRDLQQIIAIYQGSRLRPPSSKQLANVPYGDWYYWLNHGAGTA